MDFRRTVLLILCSLFLFSGCGIVQVSEEDMKPKGQEITENKNQDQDEEGNHDKLAVQNQEEVLSISPAIKNFSEQTEKFREKYPQIGKFHDITTDQVLASVDSEKIERLSIAPEKKQEFFSVFETAKNSGNLRFQAGENSKFSGKFLYFDSSEQNCGLESALSCAESSRRMNEKIQVTALFFGDMMFDRYIRETLDSKGWEHILDDEMKWFMRGTDLTFVNFESAITAETPYKAHDLMMSFTSDPKWLPKMKEYGVNAVSLGNNHSMNRGEEGFKKTLYSLAKEQILSFGNPDNNPKINNLSIIQNIRGMKIGFISYHELFRPNPKPILDEIKKLKEQDQVDFVVIFPHWGEEYKPYIQKRLQIKAHQFINAGADLIIGHHPHVVAAHEEYKGKHIYYSLGNFMFDQVRSVSVNRRLGIGITFECLPENGVGCAQKNIVPHLFPLISNKEFQVRLMNEEEQEDFSAYFQKISP